MSTKVTYFAGTIQAGSGFTGSGANITDIARANVAAGTASHVLVNDGSGLLTSEAQLATSRGGTGINTSASTGLAKVSAGTWSVATLVDADVSASAAITRSKIASGTNNHVIINNGSGVLSSEAQLAASRGGTGINTSASTGVAKVSTGTWSVATIVDADVSASAAITRSKLASGTNNHVIINNGSGVLSSEAQLAVSRGGLGADFSGVGAGPFVLTNSSGTISSSVQYTSANTASALVQRDGSGNFTAGTITATRITVPTVATSSGDLSLTPAGSNVSVGTKNIRMSAATGSTVTFYSGTVTTTDATATTIVTVPTVSTTNGGAYLLQVEVSYGSTAGSNSTGIYTFTQRVKNVATAVTLDSGYNYMQNVDSALSAATVTTSSSSQNVLVRVTGIAATTIKWNAFVRVVEQQF